MFARTAWTVTARKVTDMNQESVKLILEKLLLDVERAMSYLVDQADSVAFGNQLWWEYVISHGIYGLIAGPIAGAVGVGAYKAYQVYLQRREIQGIFNGADNAIALCFALSLLGTMASIVLLIQIGMVIKAIVAPHVIILYQVLRYVH